ncbi:MAG: redoxin family protein [Flavobacteriales bacterium]|nr:redoxin family protein [Flavobacteriales bacterium]
MTIKRSSFIAWLKTRTISDYIFGIFLLLMLIPASRKPIQVQLIRLLSFAPDRSELDNENGAPLDPNQLDWLLIDEDAQVHKFSDLVRGKTFVNHWATWCPPCVAEMPSIEELYREMKSEMDFIVFSSEPIDKLKQFKHSKGYSFPVYQLASELPDWMSKSNSIPATFVLDRSMKLRLEHRGARKWNNQSFINSLKQLP